MGLCSLNHDGLKALGIANPLDRLKILSAVKVQLGVAGGGKEEARQLARQSPQSHRTDDAVSTAGVVAHSSKSSALRGGLQEDVLFESFLGNEQSGAKDSASSGGKHLSHWSVDDVSGWLRRVVELPQYCSLFLEHGVDGDAVRQLDAEGLRELGVADAVHRLRLCANIEALTDSTLTEEDDAAHDAVGVGSRGKELSAEVPSWSVRDVSNDGCEVVVGTVRRTTEPRYMRCIVTAAHSWSSSNDDCCCITVC
eukprot:SAG31_NODE_5070_length_2761_cov_4.536439_2_plen_253_part_01